MDYIYATWISHEFLAANAVFSETVKTSYASDYIEEIDHFASPLKACRLSKMRDERTKQVAATEGLV